MTVRRVLIVCGHHTIADMNLCSANCSSCNAAHVSVSQHRVDTDIEIPFYPWSEQGAEAGALWLLSFDVGRNHQLLENLTFLEFAIF